MTAETGLANALVAAVVGGSQVDGQRLLFGTALVATVNELFGLASRGGLGWLDELELADLGPTIEAIIARALARASAELGLRLGAPDLPVFVATVIRAWATNDPDALDPEAPEFEALLERLLEQLSETMGSLEA